MNETKRDSRTPTAGWPTGFEVGAAVPIGRKALGRNRPYVAALPAEDAIDIDDLLTDARRRVAAGATGRSVYADADQPDDEVFFDFGDVEPPQDEGGAGEDEP